MAKLICRLSGVRGRSMDIFDNKCIIRTEPTAGSVISGNATDGEKTIFYIDCTGLQFKKHNLAIGFLQLETPSMQMNNQNSNFYSENTFTFEEVNGISNELMHEVYSYISRRIEGYKYGFGPEETYEPSEKMLSLLGGIGEKMIFFCENCSDAYGGDPGTVPRCPKCGGALTETSVTRANWRSLTPAEKDAFKGSWGPKKRKFF